MIAMDAAEKPDCPSRNRAWQKKRKVTVRFDLIKKIQERLGKVCQNGAL